MTNITPVPTTLRRITPTWLTAVLRDSGAIDPSDRVLSLASEPVGVGVGFLSRLYRLHLTLSGRGPASVVVKMPTDTDYLQLAEAASAYRREVVFYTDVAPECPLRTPRVYHAEMGADSTEFILALEDLGHLENGDHLAGVTFERAGSIIDELVRLHSWGWGMEPDQHTIFEPINGALVQHLYSMGVQTGWAAYVPRARVAIPKGLEAVINDWPARLAAMMWALVDPVTIVNGDLRIDNIFFAPDDSATIVDFQLAMRSAGIWDVAYVVSQGLTIEERDGRERELVERYVAGLAEAGIDYPIGRAWEQFKIALVAQIAMPLSAGMAWETLPSRAQELLHALNERAFAIITDTDALVALPA